MRKLLLLLPLLLLFACGQPVVEETTKDFPENRWDKSDVKTFDFELKDDIVSGRLVLKFSHVFEPLFNRVPLRIVMQKPDGEEEIISTALMLDDENGKHLSDCGGDLCDLKQVIKNNIPFQKGNYKITISHNFPTEYVPNVVLLGVLVEDAMRD